MRIRTQTILGITPIFTVLGAAISLLVYTSERAEVVWGLEEEVSALAVSIAEFISYNHLSGGPEDLGTRSVPDRLDAIVDFEQLKRVRFFEYKETELQLAWDRGDEKFDPAGDPGKDESQVVLEDGFWVDPTDFSSTGLLIARAAAPVEDEAGNISGLLEAITDASRLETRTKRIIWRCINITTGLTAVGFLLSVGVSGFLTRRLRRLDRAARIVAQGDYDQEIDLRSIQEVNDLGSTFNTMSSIIRDTISKAKTQLVESDQFRDPDDLAETCWQLNREKRQIALGEKNLLLGTVGNAPSGSFAGLEEKEKGGTTRCLIGAVNENDPLEASLKAAAAFAYLFRLLNDGQTPEKSLAVASEVFDFSSCRVFEYRGGNSLDYWSHSPDGTEAKVIDLEKNLPAIFTTGTPESAQIRRIIESTGEATHRNVGLLLSEDPVAAYLVVQNGPG